MGVFVPSIYRGYFKQRGTGVIERFTPDHSAGLESSGEFGGTSFLIAEALVDVESAVDKIL
jgi:hypothetical protein